MQHSLTDEEYGSIKDVRDTYNQLIYNVGLVQLEIENYEKGLSLIKKQKDELLEERDAILQKEKELSKKLFEKYGKGQIDLDNRLYLQD